MNEDTISEPNLSPQSVVDSASIANCMNMNKNKESLKLKLMLRRPIDVLVDQGILPPPKSSPLFYEQKLKLERAKTGDFLKHKIQRRPQRDELIQQHILEETFDPSYYEQERKLKKARLADDLNERLSQRPGPLELIKGNILHTDEYLEQAIKEGQITFKKTCEGEIIKNPPKRFVFEEESSSDSAPSPLQLGGKPLLVPSGNTFLSVAPSQAEPCSSVSSVLNSPLSYLVTTPVTSLLSSNTTTVLITTQPPTNTCLATSNLTTQVVNSNLVSKTIESVHIGPFKSQLTKSKKKIKSKNQPKARVIKFHEYTGPPNAKKQSNASQQDNETSYELLLKQQQLFLQWQLECQQKYPQLAKQNNIPDMTEIGTKPQIIESNASKMVNTSEILNNSNNNQCNNANACVKQIKQDEAKVQLIKSGNQKQVNVDMTLTNNLVNNAKQYAPIVKKLISKLEDMKVSDLKAELKKRNLPVSGAKQQLIERLKPFSDSVVSDTNNAISAEMKGNLMLSINNTCQNESHFSAQQELMNGIGNSLPGGTAFILNSANNNTNSGEAKQNKSLKLNEDLVLVTNNGDKFSSVPIQLSQQQNSVESQTLNIATIPITNNFIPQYQIVSSTPTDKVNLNGINLTNHQIQSPIANNILVNNNVINSSNNLQSNLTFNNPTAAIFSNKPSSNVTILTSPQLQLAQIKNGLSLNLTQPLVPNLTTNKLMSMPNSTPVFHQLLLYPSAINANQEITNVIANPKPQRSNSIPNESFHQLQRNTSLPLIINQVPVQPNVKIIRIDESETTENDNKVKTGNSVNIEQNQKYEQSVDDLNFNHTNLVSKTPLEAKVLFSKSEPIQGQHKLFGNTTTSDEKAEHSVNAKGGEMNCLEASQCLATSLKPSRIDKTSQCSDDLHVSSISDNSNNQIQPDSTTNSNTLDFDFMLNFDDLNDDFIDSNHLNNCNIDQLTEGNNMNKNGESNDMIDFGDNWFEMTFGDAQNDIKPSQMMNDTGRNVLSYEKDSNGDNSMMDTINRLFDEHPVANNGKSSNQYQVDYSRNDPNLCNNMLGRGPHSSQNNYELPSNTMDCHMNSNQNNANFNSINNRVNHYLNDNMVQSDSFADYSFFEDNDFKNSMDFAIY